VIRGLVLVLLLVAGCGVRPSDVVLGGPAPTVAPVAVVFLVASDGRVTRVLRPGPAAPDPLTLLAEGPTAVERDQGYRSEVPAGAVLSSAGGSVSVSPDSLSAVAVDQVVCTAAPDGAPVTLNGRGPLVCGIS